MGDTDFYGRVGELESLQDAYDSRTAEMAIIYGRLSSAMTFFQGKRNETFPEGFTIVS